MTRSFLVLAAIAALLPWRLLAVPATSCPAPLELAPDRRDLAKSSLTGLLQQQEMPPYTKPAGQEFQVPASSLDFGRDYAITEMLHGAALPVVVFFQPKITRVSIERSCKSHGTLVSDPA